MIGDLWGFLSSIVVSAWSMLNSSSPWLVFSFIVAGLLVIVMGIGAFFVLKKKQETDS